MDDDLAAGGGRELDVISGDVNCVSTMGRTSQGDLESGGGGNMMKKQEEAKNSIVDANQVEREIRNLLGFTDEVVNHKTLCKVALEEWEKNGILFRNHVDKLKQETRNNRNEIYQLVGFFSAFQGLLFTAVAQSSLLHKNNRGFPLALSAFATVLTVIGVGQKNMQIREFRKTIKGEDPTRQVLDARVRKLKEQGIKFSFQTCADEEDNLVKARPAKLAAAHKGACATFLGLLISYEAGVVVVIILFGGLCLVAMNQILCNPM
ncbi:unnamed protein product [Sphagnum jensenii]|uniref:SMODS and SLOG-associating 2TM effector domain-containing protein n=1 Tax=Sphagnum jensenii TaxID=128206 RepID=A0ABP1ADZ4_9BRYO